MQVIFLTYINRSGSTFLVNQLSKLNEFLIIPEGEILVRQLLLKAHGRPGKKTLDTIFQDHKVKHWNWDIADVKDSFQEMTNAELFFHLLELYREYNKPHSKILVFKAWELIYTLGKIPTDLIVKYHLKYLALYRDVRAIVSSQRYTIYKGKPLENNTVTATIKWRDFIRICQKNHSLVTLLRYEEMITGFDNFFRSLFHKLEIEGDPSFGMSSGSITESLPHNQKPLHPHIDLNPKPEFTEKWKSQLPDEDIKIIQKLATREMSQFDYDSLQVNASLAKLVFKWIKYFTGYILISIIHLVHQQR